MVSKIKTTTIAGGIITPVAMSFLADSLRVMIPWLITIAAFIIGDLISGIRKSLKLGIHVSIIRAIRETMGKFVVYFAFVLAVCMADTAVNHTMGIARWSCLFIIGMEICSIISNILKPYGIDFSLKGLIKLFLAKSPLAVNKDEADEILEDDSLEEIKKEEAKKWEDKK